MFFTLRMPQLPDVLFDVVLTFCTSAEIVGWTAEAVRTKDEIASKLLQIAKSIPGNFDTMSPLDIFWASGRLLTIPTPQKRFQGIDFESATFWLLHKQLWTPNSSKQNMVFCEWLEINQAMLQGRTSSFDTLSQMCVAITHAFFGECSIATRFYIQRKLYSFTYALEGKTTCVIVNCPCRY